MGNSRGHLPDIFGEDDHQFRQVVPQVLERIGGEVDLITRRSTRRFTVSLLIGRNHTISRLYQYRHHPTPTVGKFGKAMKQEYDVVAVTFVKIRHLQSVTVIDLVHTVQIVDGFGSWSLDYFVRE